MPHWVHEKEMLVRPTTTNEAELLSKRGSAGWELVCMVPGDTTPVIHTYYFKKDFSPAVEKNLSGHP